MLKLFWNIFIYVLFMAWAFIFFENAVRSKYFIDEDNKLIFYPDNTQKGYVATREQIDECAKAFKNVFSLISKVTEKILKEYLQTVKL